MVSLEQTTDLILKKTDHREFAVNGSAINATFNITEPTTIQLAYGLDKFDMYVEPGDDLLVSFDGVKFLPTLFFNGKGSIHNNYLKQWRIEFKETNDNVITYSINSKKAIEYKTWLTEWHQKRWSFYQKYNTDEKNQFSSAFKQYAFANIDYWYAYHLLRYKPEHESTNVLEQDIDIPYYYYDFLNKIFINNDAALTNWYYRTFAAYYLEFRKENLDSDYGWANQQNIFEYVGIGTALNSMPFGNNPISMVQRGTKLLYLNDNLNYSNGLGEKIAYRIKVRTEDGFEGYMKSAATNIIYKDSFNLKESKIEQVKWTTKKVSLVGIVTINQLRLLYDPFENAVVSELNLTDTVTYMNQRTSELLPYRHDSTFQYKDRFYKVRTAAGKIGWISGGCFKMVEKENEIVHLKERLEPKSETIFNEIDRYFAGKTKCYVVALDIAQRLHFEQPDKVKPQYVAFMNDNDSKNYQKSAQFVFDEAIKNPSDQNINAPIDFVILGTKAIVHNVPKLSFKLDPKPESLTPIKTDDTPSNTPKTSVNEAANTIAPSHSGNINFGNDGLVKNIKITKVGGQIIEPNGEKLQLTVFSDPLQIGEESFLIVLDNQNGFSQSLEITEAVAAELSYGNVSIPLFLEPGDDINLQFNANSMLKSLRYSGQGGAHAQYLRDFKQKFENTQTALKNNIRFNNASEFKVFMADAVKLMQQYYSAYPSMPFFTEGFKQYTTAYYNYWFGFNMLNFPYEHPLYYGETEPMELSAFYYDFMAQLPLNNDFALNQKFYTYFVDQYISNQKRVLENKKLTPFELADKFLTGRVKTYYLSKIWAQQITNTLTDEKKADLQTFINNNNDNLFKTALKRVYFRNAKLQYSSIAPPFKLLDKDGKDVQLSDFAGKVVYLDFWATWCAPCLNSIKQSQELKTKFKEGEVVFLYISLDYDVEKWKNYVSQQNILGVNVYANNNALYQVSIKDLYHVQQLPMSFLIDKKGNIASDPAQRLNNEQLMTNIQQLLAQ